MPIWVVNVLAVTVLAVNRPLSLSIVSKRVFQHSVQCCAFCPRSARFQVQAGFIGASGEWHETTPMGRSRQRFGHGYSCKGLPTRYFTRYDENTEVTEGPVSGRLQVLSSNGVGQ